MTIPARVPLDDDRTVPCRNNDPDLWYPKPGKAGQPAKAKAVKLCGMCPRKAECLERALAFREVDFGIWAGLTHTERAGLLRPVRRPTGAPGPPRPVPPPRNRVRFANWKYTAPPSSDSLRNVFDAARAFLDGDGTRAAVAVRYGVSEPRMAQAVSVLRYCPDLEGDVTDGWIPWRHAAGYAQQVKQWELDREAREAAMGVAA